MGAASDGSSAGIEYTVAWCRSGGSVARGSLRLSRSGLVLRGVAADGSVARERVPLDRIASVQVGRAPGERVQGERSVMLTLRGGESLAVAPFGAGEVFELAELVAELSSADAHDSERVTVVLPLRRGTADRARELASAGPPFDLEQAGLDRHHVFVTEHEAVFLFEGAGARAAVERLVRTPATLRAAGRWRDCVAGPPRLAEESFAWRRSASD